VYEDLHGGNHLGHEHLLAHKVNVTSDILGSRSTDLGLSVLEEVGEAGEELRQSNALADRLGERGEFLGHIVPHTP
jgi:hypothetical protein